jgi:ABC-type sugar transport system ATPase subunit
MTDNSPIATRSPAMHEHAVPPSFTAATDGHAVGPDAATVVFDIDDLSVLYGDFRAVRDVTLDVHQHEITAFIGPSGCGKTTVLRCFNRMNDFIETAKVEGIVNYHGVNLYDSGVNATEVRRRIGMVFQKPNPFPKSIYDNVAYGPRLAGVKKRSELDVIVERSLRGAALRRSAAATVHRQGDRRRAGGHPDGRAVLVARPDRHGPHRGADAGDQDEVHDRHRDPQHAAGGSGQRSHGVLHDGDQPRERPAHGTARGVQPDGNDLLQSG